MSSLSRRSHPFASRAVCALALACALALGGCGRPSGPHVARTLSVPGYPFGVVADSTGRLFVSCLESRRIMAFEPPKAEPVFELELAGAPAGLALTPSERGLLVLQAEPSRVALVALAADPPRVTASWPIPGAASAMAVSADGNRAWVTHEGAPGVSLVDLLHPGSTPREIALPGATAGVATAFGRAYVSGPHPDAEAGLLWVLEDPFAEKDLPLEDMVRARVTVGLEPTRIALVPPAGPVLVLERGAERVSLFDRELLETEPDSALLGHVATDPGALGMAVAKARSWVLVTHAEPPNLVISKLGQDQEAFWTEDVARIALPSRPVRMAVGPWEKHVYLTHGATDTLSFVALD